MSENMQDHRNIFGKVLEICNPTSMTGFNRDGFCKVTSDDINVHAVCVQVTDKFLKFSKKMGNDLSTPNPMTGFHGLLPGDTWCICAPRWKEALAHGAAPLVNLAATHEAALLYVSLEDLLTHSLDSGRA